MENITKELEKDGQILKEISKKEQTADMCKIAINQNPKALKFASVKCIDYKICLNAVKREPNVFRYVPKRLITEEISMIAVTSNAELIKNVPEEIRTNEMYLKAIMSDPDILSLVSIERRYELFNQYTSFELIKKIVEHSIKWLLYMPIRKDVIELCITYMQKDFTIVQFLPENIRNNKEILEFQKKLGKLTYLSKYYDLNEKAFIVKIEVIYNEELSTYKEKYITYAKFNNFDDFYNFLDGDLYDAELTKYEFKDVNLKKYNIQGAAIHNEVLVNQGLYDDTYFNAIKEHIMYSENDDVLKNEIAIKSDDNYLNFIENNEYNQLDNEHIQFFYISDIHLAHRVFNKFKDRGTKEEIKLYIKNLACQMVKSVQKNVFNSYLIIAGDTSSVFEFSKIFYKKLIELWNPSKIIVISGNHELWDPYIELENNIKIYKEFFNQLGIIYLQNSLFCVKEGFEKRVIEESEILSYSIENIQNIVQKCSIVILGGIGFSGLNHRYNAVNMPYGKSFEYSVEEAIKRDIQETKKFNDVYKKIYEAIPNNKVIVVSHMRKEDWNDENYNPNWIYINGHNHRNFYEVSDRKTVYADNQIGYRGHSIGLKYFYINNEYDTFIYLEDGIHEITKKQYKDFNRGKQVQMSFEKENGEIYMIKKNGNYMFFMYCYYSQNSKEPSLYLLKGGKLCGLERNSIDDLMYYYDNFGLYIKNIYKLLDKYSSGQKKLSKFIKLLGGSGNVHGCIIDIEKPNELEGFSYCHLFVNPIDGKITPYFAYDNKSRVVYRDIKTLLNDQVRCKSIMDNYLRIEQESKEKLPIISYSNELDQWENKSSRYDEGSYIYRISNIIKSLQYCTEKNIVRIWNEDLLNYDFVNRIVKANTIENITEGNFIIEKDE